jgi:hypothetical protein
MGVDVDVDICGHGSVAPGVARAAAFAGPHRFVSPVHAWPDQYRYWPAVQGSAYQPGAQVPVVARDSCVMSIGSRSGSSSVIEQVPVM